MPQIGWLEILIVVILAILIIGPKDIPQALKKIGSWVGTFKSYFSDIQKDISDVEKDIDDQLSFEKEFTEEKNNNKKDE
jgi:sec-independent protein translocase protein TatB